jgi:UDP-hydrolysing UDP-N-acetyl-D-glucosamine 2-epimerase
VVRIVFISGSTSDLDIGLRIISAARDNPNLIFEVALTAENVRTSIRERRGLDKNLGFEVHELKTFESRSLPEVFARTVISVSEFLENQQFDAVLIVGDRFEALAASVAAHYSRTRIIHVHGGESTPNSLDDLARHCISTFASLHFVATEESSLRLLKRLEAPGSIIVAGAPGSFSPVDRLLSRAAMAEKFGLDVNLPWYVLALHPDSPDVNVCQKRAHLLVENLRVWEDCEVIITGSNDDPGGSEMNEFWISASENVAHFHFVSNFGMSEFHSLLASASGIIGNSSAIVHEVPQFRTPRILIGDRQLGREGAENIVTFPWSANLSGIRKQLDSQSNAGVVHFRPSNPSEIIAEGLLEFLSGKPPRTPVKYVR